MMARDARIQQQYLANDLPVVGLLPQLLRPARRADRCVRSCVHGWDSGKASTRKTSTLFTIIPMGWLLHRRAGHVKPFRKGHAPLEWEEGPRGGGLSPPNSRGEQLAKLIGCTRPRC